MSDGAYFALSYRGKQVCIDSGLNSILSLYIQELGDRKTLDEIDRVLAHFLLDYPKVWWKNPKGEMLECTKITCAYLQGPHYVGGLYVGSNILTLSPHYKVPNHAVQDRRQGSVQPLCA